MKYLSCCRILLQEPDESASSYEQWKSGYAIWGHWLSGEFLTYRMKCPTNLALQKYGFKKIIKIPNRNLLWDIVLSLWIELSWKCSFLLADENRRTRKKKTLGARRELATSSTHLWRRAQDSNPGHIGGRRALKPLCHPCFPTQQQQQNFNYLSI